MQNSFASRHQHELTLRKLSRFYCMGFQRLLFVRKKVSNLSRHLIIAKKEVFEIFLRALDVDELAS